MSSKLMLAFLAGCLVLMPGAFAFAAPAPAGNTTLDAELFYQLLVGELELRTGAPVAAFELIMDAAHKTKDAKLFRRAADIARYAKDAQRVLIASQTWSEALPNSIQAHGYHARSLLELGRVSEAVEPLGSMIRLTAPASRAVLITALPRLLARASDRRAAAMALQASLTNYLNQPETSVAAHVALGRVWLAAQNSERALAFATQAHASAPGVDAPALLALDLMSRTPEAESLVVDHLATKPTSNTIRLAYARMLMLGHRYLEAIAQFDLVANNDPASQAAWLSLGALHLELKQARQATNVLRNYLRLAGSDEPTPRKPGNLESVETDDDRPTRGGLAQAYLMLANAAEVQGDFSAAEAWLEKVKNSKRVLDVRFRRASILARQGKLAQARAFIRNAPEKATGDARAKLLAEVQILRDLRLWAEANAVLTVANLKYVGDVDLLYEQSTVAEKLGLLDEMERLLRRVIEINKNYHHAYNALGYSLADRNLRLPEARALISKALELKPGEPFITDSLGWVEYRLGNREEAARLLRLAYRSRPDAEIAAHLAEVLWVSGQRDEARRILRDAQVLDATNEVLRETVARLQVDL